MAKKTCGHCGTALTGKANEVLPDGAEQERCPKCRRVYVITIGKKVEEKNPEPKPGAEPKVEPPVEE